MPLTNTQYEQLMREYNRLQARDHHALIARRQNAYAKIPQLAHLNDRIGELAVDSACAALAGDAARSARLDQERHAIDQQIRSLLEEAGLSPDYLQMQYHCADCRDTGYVNGQKCHCFHAHVIDLFYTQPALREALKKENFSTFDFNCYDDLHADPATGLTPRRNMHSIVRTCREFIDGFDEAHSSLLFYGGPGLGKTFLSHCIARELIEKGRSVLYYSSASLFDQMARSAFEKDAQVDPFITYIMECDLLIIDDLGTEMTNAFVSATFFRIINERLGAGRSMLISTNLTLPDLARIYSERSFSRITAGFTLLGFFGDDIRIRQKLTLCNT